MRKILPFLSLAAVAALATPAVAEPADVNPNYGAAYVGLDAIGGAAVGTAVGVGLYNGWYSGAFAASLPATAAGAAVTGGVAGIGTVALIDAAVEPCRGFHALLGMNEHECVNGQYVGDQPRVVSYHRGRRIYR